MLFKDSRALYTCQILLESKEGNDIMHIEATGALVPMHLSSPRQLVVLIAIQYTGRQSWQAALIYLFNRCGTLMRSITQTLQDFLTTSGIIRLTLIYAHNSPFPCTETTIPSKEWTAYLFKIFDLILQDDAVGSVWLLPGERDGIFANFPLFHVCDGRRGCKTGQETKTKSAERNPHLMVHGRMLQGP